MCVCVYIVCVCVACLCVQSDQKLFSKNQLSARAALAHSVSLSLSLSPSCIRQWLIYAQRMQTMLIRRVVPPQDSAAQRRLLRAAAATSRCCCCCWQANTHLRGGRRGRGSQHLRLCPIPDSWARFASPWPRLRPIASAVFVLSHLCTSGTQRGARRCLLLGAVAIHFHLLSAFLRLPLSSPISKPKLTTAWATLPRLLPLPLLLAYRLLLLPLVAPLWRSSSWQLLLSLVAVSFLVYNACPGRTNWR